MEKIDAIENHRLTSDARVRYQSSPKRKRYVAIGYIWKDFVSKTTMHGLHFIFEKRPVIQRFLWFLLLLLMFVVFVWQMLTLVLNYFEYKVTSSVRLISEQQSIFPAVTICNFNQYRMSMLKEGRFKEIVEGNNPLFSDGSKPLDWKNYSDEVTNIDMEKTVRSVGHQLEYDKETGGGMLYNCIWKGQKCNHLNFTTILTNMGVCYTFNSGKETELLKVSSSGNSFGLKLTLSVEQEEYLGHDTFSAGLKISVHSQDEPPLVNNFGFAAMPGAHVFAAISRTRIISLKRPYETMCDDRVLYNVKKYSKAACYDTCKENFVIKHCKCRAYYMRDTRYRQCNIQEYFTCVIPKEEIFSSEPLNGCNCPDSCDVTKYGAYLSYGKYPSWESNKLYANNSEAIMEKYRRNVVQLDIFFEELHYNVLEQVPRSTRENLLGELGGLLGLYLGASLLTVIEFFDVTLAAILARIGIYKPRVS